MGSFVDSVDGGYGAENVSLKTGDARDRISLWARNSFPPITHRTNTGQHPRRGEFAILQSWPGFLVEFDPLKTVNECVYAPKMISRAEYDARSFASKNSL